MVDSLTIYYSVYYKVILKRITYGFTNWNRLVLLILHYFRFLIIKFNFKTPGREDKEQIESVEATERADTIIKGLGGATNIEEVDCCATRLRVTLKDGSLLSKDTLMTTDAKGVIIRGNGAQIVYGPHVTTIKMKSKKF